uniref:AB hydrolase-1 domain-containing protein n=1 Tax=Chrysotila carterae TaxID=13221 RepID=A0A7S4C6B5_CHRCT|mmetsp:Transcript_28300/g.61952  ORF Transcript_28300/g.61952 Transcript_28300/m.61952 type:complete len:321 (+) Transcript_28300:240-1202(+)
MLGSLFRYGAAGLTAFQSGCLEPHHGQCVIYLGGLTDGLLACPYVDQLSEACGDQQLSMVQPVLSSSYSGFGCCSLDSDVKQLCELVVYMQKEKGMHEFILVGHSTGCQIAVHFLARAPSALRRTIRGAVLQAPVSDRESNAADTPSGPQWASHGLSSQEEHDTLLREAQGLVASGRGETLLATKYYGVVPITAARYSSLNARGGTDDYFSSDYSDSELQRRLRHLSTNGQRMGTGLSVSAVAEHPGLAVLFALSGDDEYVPRSTSAHLLGQRFAAAASTDGEGSSAIVLNGANHNLSEPQGVSAAFVEACVAHIHHALA